MASWPPPWLCVLWGETVEQAHTAMVQTNPPLGSGDGSSEGPLGSTAFNGIIGTEFLVPLPESCHVGHS